MKTQQPEALRLADAIENGVPTPTKADVSAELRRQHARIVELEAEKVLNDRKQRFAIAEALGLGNANYAWSYLHDQIKSLLKCEEDLIALRKQAAAQQAVQADTPTQQELDAQTIKHISALSELVRMPNAEHFADAHNAAVRHLRALAAQAKQGEQP